MKLPQDMKIIYVEDYDAYVRLMEITLREAGVDNEIIPIVRGSEALHFFSTLAMPPIGPPPQSLLVLLDIDLPGVSSRDILLALRARDAGRRIPVFIVTCFDDPADRQQYLALGADGVLSKPLDPQAFEQAMAHLHLLAAW